MNLCGDKYEEAVSSNNISLSTGMSELYNLTAPVCRMTVIPETTRVITTQSMSLAERLVGIYEDVDENSTEPSVFSEEGGPVTNKSSFFLFKFHSGSITKACPDGRSVWVTVLCDVTAAGKVQFKIGQDRGKKILKKIRDMASGGKKKKVTFDDDDDDYFESVHLESGKEAYSEEFN